MRIIPLFILFLTGLAGRAQITFPVPGAKWHYAYYQYMSPNISNQLVTVSSSTVVAGKVCYQLYGLYDYGYCGSLTPSYFYTSNDSVFFNNGTTQNQWQLLYDFNATAGSSWKIFPQTNGINDTVLVTVDSVGFKIINSVSLKALYVTYHQVLNDGVGMPSPYVYNSVILDRVGDLMYTINYQPDVNGWCDSGSERFLCYEDSVLGVYQKDTLPCSYTNVGIHETAAKPEIRVYPNPASRELIIESIDRIEHESALYDIAGRKMAVGKGNINVAALVDGMYFLEVRSEHGASGQKILVRH